MDGFFLYVHLCFWDLWEGLFTRWGFGRITITRKQKNFMKENESLRLQEDRYWMQKGRILADNKTVCTISVIHSQIKEPQKVIEVLSKELEIDTDTVRKKLKKISSIERIKTNVEKSVGDVIRGYELDGVKVDEDYKRYYPYGSLASKVLGFTGGDNRG